MHKVWFHAHLWLGWAAAMPLLIIAATGALLSFEEEFYRWEQPEHYALTPQPDPIDVAGVLEILKSSGLYINHLEVPDDPRQAYLAFASDASPDGSQRGLRAYVDPNERKLTREYDNPTFIRKIEVWHRTLTAGRIGRWIVAGSSLSLAIVTMAGLVLWWRIKAGTLSRAARRGSQLDWHNLVGVVGFIPLIILALTGVTFTWGPTLFPVMDRWVGRSSTPQISKIAPPPEATGPIPIAQAVKSVARAFPGWKVRGVQDARRGAPYRFMLRPPDTMHPGGTLQVFVNPYTGNEVGRWDIRESGPVGWYRRYFYIAHTGHGFSPLARAGWAFASLMSVALIVTGCWISIRRWTLRSGSRQGTLRVDQGESSAGQSVAPLKE